MIESMGTSSDLGVRVEPTRIGEIGVGSFLLLVGAIIYLLQCFFGTTFLNGQARLKLNLISTFVYGSLIIFLANAKRRSRWAAPEDVVSDVDDLWLVHILIGSSIVLSSVVAVVAVFKLDYCSQVVAKEIDTERDKRWNGPGRAKFLF